MANTSTIHANNYSTTVETVAAAIKRSVSHTEIATIVIAGSERRAAIEAELGRASDDTVATNDEHGTVEFWGVWIDDFGDEVEWRVHVVN